MRDKYGARARQDRSGRVVVLCLLSLCLALSGIILMVPLTPTALADGGAPNLAYVAGGGQGVSVIDIGQQKVTHNLALGGDPAMVFLTLDGRYIYVAQPGQNKVTMLAALTEQPVCSVTIAGQPSLFAFDAGVNTLYVAGNGSSKITALNGNSCNIKKTISTDGPVYGMGTAEVGSGQNGGTGNQLWFTTTAALNVYQQGKIQKIAVPGGPQYLSIPPGATVYVTTRQGGVVAVNLQTLQASSPLVSGGDFGPMDFDAQTGEIYVPDKAHNRLVVLTPLTYGSDTIPPEPNHVIPMAATPQSVAITADGNLGFVALAGGTVAMLDIPGKMQITTFDVGGTPRFIITGLYPPPASSAVQQSTNDNGTPIPTTLLYIMAVVALLLLLAIAALIVLAQRRKTG